MPTRRQARPPTGGAQRGNAVGPRSYGPCRILLAWLVPALATSSLHAQQAEPFATPRYQVEASLTHDDNVSRGRVSGDILRDQSVALRASRDWSAPISANTRWVLTAVGGGEVFATYSRLSRVFLEGQAAVEYRASGSFSAPTFTAFVTVAGDESRSTLRSGHRGTVGGSVSAALTDRVFVVASVSHEQHVARSAVFSGRSQALRLNADYAVTPRGTLYAGVELRRGDANASGGATLENIDIAKFFVDDDAFAGSALKTYRFDADTVVAVVGFNLGFGSSTSLDLSWRQARTRPNTALPFATDVPDRYVANQWVLAVSRRF